MTGDTSLETVGDLTILPSATSADTGIIFYPGAKVEAISYLPLLDRLRNEGYTCVLVKMPLNMAIFDADAADGVFEQLPDIKHWYIAGHSMGGAMASDYASRNPDKCSSDLYFQISLGSKMNMKSSRKLVKGTLALLRDVKIIWMEWNML